MLFYSKKEIFFWLIGFFVVNICMIIPILSLENISIAVWGILIGCDVFFSVFLLIMKYIFNKQDLKKYDEIVVKLQLMGVRITALQLMRIYDSGFGIDEKGQIVRIDRDGNALSLPSGHKIILNKKGFPIEIDEQGLPIREAKQKSFFYLVVIISIIILVTAIGGFVILCTYFPTVGLISLILFLLILLFVALYSTRRKTTKSS